tara:strand:- start:9159 stop:9500 length:342 start_codon:yes stop_codon:yes gene_type:complete
VEGELVTLGTGRVNTNYDIIRKDEDNMAQRTKCLTSGAQFHIRVSSEYDHISVAVDLPTYTLEGVDKEEAELLSRLIHNQMELVLRPYFERQNQTSTPAKAKAVPEHAKLRLV